VAVLGGSVIALAAVLFFTPAPSILVFLVGLGILASEFLWAGRLLQRVKNLRKTERNAEA
jgi:tellurite resistance protein TerC